MPEGYNFRAVQPIDVGFARAFNPGDLVPDDTVEREGWLDAGLVEPHETPAAEPVPFDAGKAAADLAALPSVPAAPPAADEKPKTRS